MAAELTDTIVGANVELKGSLHNRGPIQVHGKVTGDIFSDALVVVGETAVITGPIIAKQVDVSGKVVGSITAEEQIELQPKSVVKGDISTSRLSIKPGAIFIGKSQMNVSTEKEVVAEIAAEPAEEAPVEKKKPRLEID